jgi:hypothetical protein
VQKEKVTDRGRNENLKELQNQRAYWEIGIKRKKYAITKILNQREIIKPEEKARRLVIKYQLENQIIKCYKIKEKRASYQMAMGVEWIKNQRTFWKVDWVKRFKVTAAER